MIHISKQESKQSKQNVLILTSKYFKKALLNNKAVVVFDSDIQVSNCQGRTKK